MQIKSLLKITLVFTLCVIMHSRAYTSLAIASSKIVGGDCYAD